MYIYVYIFIIIIIIFFLTIISSVSESRELLLFLSEERHRVINSDVMRRGLTSERDINLANIRGTRDRGYIRGCNLLSEQFLPINPAEEGHPLYLVGVREPCLGVLNEQPQQQRLGILGDVLRERKCVGYDPLVHVLHVCGVEGRQPRDHLVQERPVAPPVDSLPVAISQQNLRREVLGGPAESVCLVLFAEDPLLGEAKVREADVPLVCQEDVLGLQIAVNNASVVKMLQCQTNLSRIEADSFHREAVLLLKVVEKLPSIHKIQYQVELIVRLK